MSEPKAIIASSPTELGSAPWDKRAWIEVGLVVAVALLVRALYLFWAQGEIWFYVPLADSKNYNVWAQAILSGDFLGTSAWKHSPLYAFWVAGIYALTNSIDPDVVEKIQLLVVAPLACALMYLLGRRLANGAVGLIAGLLQAVYAPGIFFEGNLLSPLLIHVLNMSALLTAYVAAKRGQWQFWAVPGLLLGLSMLARPNVALWLPVLGIWIWMQSPAPAARRRVIKSVLCLGLGAGILLVPVAIRNQLVLQETIFTVPSGGINFYLGNHSTASGYLAPKGSLGISAAGMLAEGRAVAEQRLGRAVTFSESSRYWAGLAWRDIAADPSRWLELLVKKFFRMVNDYEYTTSLNYNYVHAETPFFRFPWLSFGSVFALALVGMWLGRKRWQEWLPIFGLAGVYVISNVFILISAEYRYGLMPALFFFAGLAVNESITSLRLKRWQALTLPGLLLLVAFWVSFAPALPEEVKHYHLGMAYKKMGLALEDAGAYTKAARAFEASLKFFQDQDKYIPEAQFLLGRVYLRLGSADEAVRHLAAAHAQFPQDKNVNNVLVSALSRQGDYPRALKICREMAEQDPQNPGTWVSLGAALLWMGKDAQAQAAFGQALQLNPTLVNSIQNEREQIINNRSSGPKQP